MRRPPALVSARAVGEEVGPPSGKVARMVREEVGLANGEQVCLVLNRCLSPPTSPEPPCCCQLPASCCQDELDAAETPAPVTAVAQLSHSADFQKCQDLYGKSSTCGLNSAHNLVKRGASVLMGFVLRPFLVLYSMTFGTIWLAKVCRQTAL